MAYLGILTLMHLFFLSSAADIKWTHSYSKEWVMRGNTTFVYPSNHFGHKEDSFLYAICSPSELFCTLYNDVQVGDGAWITDICTLNATEHSNNDEFTGKVELRRYWDEIVYLIWIMAREDKSEYSISAILNAHKCGFHAVTSDFDDDFTFPVENHALNWKKWVEIDYVDEVHSGQKMCGYPGICRITYQIFNDKKIGYPVRLPAIEQSRTGLRITAVSNNTFMHYVTEPEGVFRLIHINAANVSKELVNGANYAEGPISTSNAHNYFGICWNRDNGRMIECKQYNSDGRPRMDVAYLKFDKPVSAFAVHNVQNRGFLILSAGQCELHHVFQSKKFVCKRFDISSSQVFFNGKMTVLKVASIPNVELECKPEGSRLALDITESDEDFCFYMACSHDQTGHVDWQTNRSRVKFYKKCLAKESIE